MIKDWRGNEIQVGDTVIYPGRMSSSLWLSEATVLDILPAKRLRVSRQHVSGLYEKEGKVVVIGSRWATKVTPRG